MLAKIAVGILIVGFFGTPILMVLGMAAYTLADALAIIERETCQ